MFALFSEAFEIKKDGMPGGWLVEKNSDLPISAVESGDRSIGLLSPGNKYIPVIPSVSDAEMRLTASFNFEMARHFDLIISFRYDISTRTGEAVRIRKLPGEQDITVECGVMADNTFTMKHRCALEITEDVLKRRVEIFLKLKGGRIELKFAGESVEFKTEKSRAGRFAVSRGHFFDILNIHRCEIFTEEEPAPVQRRQFSVMLPREPTLYPVRCDISLKDYGDCGEADLTLSGGVRDTPVGEGDYHGQRTDFLTNPFFKIITAESMEKFVIHQGSIVLVKEELAPQFFYKLLHEKVDWPLARTVRFMTPETEYCMAVGADEFYHSTAKTMAQSPGETMFDLEGNELYSGAGLTERPQTISFLSQADKAIIRELPVDDPRYDRAVEFAKNNHYFKEGEDIKFIVEIVSEKELPEDFDITLENAYLEKQKTLNYRNTRSRRKMGVRTLSVSHCECLNLKGLSPGVYHIRCVSTDASVSPVEDYCAFEVMSRQPDAPPPPLISGLPYLYTSRTETRGLETDAFDPWFGGRVDEGHYMSCANFLPKCARDNHIAPTVKAYQREWFLWLGTRCCDRPLIEDNKDLLAEADYANVDEELGKFCLLWLDRYEGEILEHVMGFAEQTGCSGLDIEKIRKMKENNLALDEESFNVIARHYWLQWLDFINERIHAKQKKFLKKMREKNPNIMFAGYGPAPIYASHYKGKEFVRVLSNELVSTGEQGFWQYEDYPFACSYGIERGTFFLTSALMAKPGHRIYPEIYTVKKGGGGGCPDGAVFYAHPPFGRRMSNDPLRIKRRIYDYAFASAHYTGKSFDYWRKYGFQTCGFERDRYEVLLKAWRVVRDYPPERPLRCAAFVYSEESLRANAGRTVLQSYGGVVDVRKISGEAVPFAYEMSRKRQAPAGFLTDMESIPELDEKQAGLLVLPPLAGVSGRHLEAIRLMHGKGVNLLAFEDVTGLEDLFGVKDSGSFSRVRRLKAEKDFLNGMTEYCDEPLCEGKYEPAGADILINAEIPVLLTKGNPGAEAVLFNIPPTLVRDDQLHERLGYGLESISRLINAAAGELVKKLSGSPVETSAGRIIAFRAINGACVLVVSNPDETDYITPLVRIKKESPGLKLASCDTPFHVIEEDWASISIRLKIGEEESAVIVFKEGSAGG